MKRVLESGWVCCVLDKKKLIQALKQLSFGESLGVIIDNTRSMKGLVQKFAENEDCRVTESVNENGTTHLIIERRSK